MMQHMDTLQTLVTEHPFLAGLRPEFYKLFHDCGTVRRFASKQQMFYEGGEADHFYLILSGSVALETFVPGCGTVTIQKVKAGEALGWSWLFRPHQWHFTATTCEPTEVIALDAAVLRAKVEQDRDFRDELLIRVTKTLHERLMGTRKQLIDLYRSTVRQRHEELDAESP